jgi:hypothetical protein
LQPTDYEIIYEVLEEANTYFNQRYIDYEPDVITIGKGSIVDAEGVARAIEGVQVVLSLVAGVPLLRARIVELITLMGGV